MQFDIYKSQRHDDTAFGCWAFSFSSIPSSVYMQAMGRKVNLEGTRPAKIREQDTKGKPKKVDTLGKIIWRKLKTTNIYFRDAS